MMKKLLFLLLVFMSTLPAWAETPEECYNKHHDAMMCMFFKTPKFTGKLENFDIERIAIYPLSQKVAIKTTQRANDVVKKIKDLWKDDDSIMYIAFIDGSALAFNPDNLFLIYVSTKGEKASFPLDEYRQELYDDILKSSKE